MSYSRWGNSNWYAFYNASSGYTKASQVLSLWYAGEKGITDWEYSDFDDINVYDLMKHYNCTIEEAIEAMTYIQQFKKDVEEEFKDEE